VKPTRGKAKETKGEKKKRKKIFENPPFFFLDERKP
jgi:hypothetical protein